MSLVAALGRIDDIQQRIRSLSSEPVTTVGTSDAATPAAGATSATTATANAFADAVRDAGEFVAPQGGEVTGSDIVAQAKNYLGVPYVFGGEDRSGMDCSGLVQRVLADLGIDVPRVVKDQADVGVEIPSLAEAQPGDLLVTKGEGHIVIYAGDGMVIHAPSPGKFVELRNNWLKDGDIATIRRMVPNAEAPAAAPLTLATSAAAPADRTGLAAATAALLAPAASPLGALGDSAAASAAARSLASVLSSADGGTGGATALASATPLTAAAGGVADSPLGLAVAQAVARASANGAAAGASAGASTSADSAAASFLSAAAQVSAPQTTTPDAAPSAAAAAPAARSSLAPQVTAPVLSLVGRGEGDHTLTLRVTPDELGPVTVKAHITGGSIAIELASGSAAGRDALRALLVDLRRDLAVLAPHSTVSVASADAPRGDTATGTGGGWNGAGQSASGQSSGGSSGHPAPQRGDSDRQLVGVPATAPATPPASAAPRVGGVGIDLFA